MAAQRGRFFVLEGLDGSGTTTQAQRLFDHLGSEGIAATLTHEPTDHPIGKLVRDGLSGNLVGSGSMGKITLSESSLCLLFAADRIEHSVEIEHDRAQKTHVISDRYVLSSIAYQSLEPTIEPERVVEVNRGIAIPDVTFLLDVTVDDCLKRLERRADSPTVYEKKDILDRIAANYESTLPLYQKRFGPVIRIDGSQSVDDVHAEIVGHLSTYL